MTDDLVLECSRKQEMTAEEISQLEGLLSSVWLGKIK